MNPVGFAAGSHRASTSIVRSSTRRTRRPPYRAQEDVKHTSPGGIPDRDKVAAVLETQGPVALTDHERTWSRNVLADVHAARTLLIEDESTFSIVKELSEPPEHVGGQRKINTRGRNKPKSILHNRRQSFSIRRRFPARPKRAKASSVTYETEGHRFESCLARGAAYLSRIPAYTSPGDAWVH